MANALIQYRPIEYAQYFIPPYGSVNVHADALDHLLARMAYEPQQHMAEAEHQPVVEKVLDRNV